MECFMGIDAGTSGVKVIMIDGGGNVLGEGYSECDVITLRPGWVEQNPEKWWLACDAAAKQAVSRSGCGRELKAIGFSGQMQGSVLLDRNKELIGNCMIWLDQRAEKEAEELNGRLPRECIMDVPASYCLPSYWAAKLLWLRRNAPSVYERINTVLFPKDYLRYLLTGEIATDVSDASCSWFMDLKLRQWSDMMFDIVGVERSIVPKRLLESGDIAGTLLPAVAARWGVPAGIPVVAGAGDQEAGGVGVGVLTPGETSVTIGTSGVVFGCCNTPFIDTQRRGMYSECHAIRDMFIYLGCTLGAGGSFKWMRDTFFADKKVEFAASGKNIYDYMTALAETVLPGSGGLCFLPYLGGEGTPYVDPDARGVFFGLGYESNLAAMCRAVMEGVTFSLRDTLEIIRESRKLEIHRIKAMGGGAKSRLWRQIQADIFNAEVCTMNISEGPATGAAILAAVGAGSFANVEEACGSIVKIESVVEPNPKTVKRYHQYYHTYKHLYAALKDSFAAQAKIAAPDALSSLQG